MEVFRLVARHAFSLNGKKQLTLSSENILGDHTLIKFVQTPIRTVNKTPDFNDWGGFREGGS